MRFAVRVAGLFRTMERMPPPGYGGFGGSGPGPTGLVNSPNAPGSAASQLLNGTQNSVRQFVMILSATGVVQAMQYGVVPPGHTVLVRGHNGGAGNTNNVRVSRWAESLGSIGGNSITPDTEIVFPVDNLCNIFAVGTAGDGLIITVQQQRIG